MSIVHRLCLGALFMAGLIAFSGGSVHGEPVADQSDGAKDTFATESQVEDYIRYFLRGVKKGKRWRGAEELAGLITEYSANPGTVPEKHMGSTGVERRIIILEPVDPLLVAVNFALESSFYTTAKGAIGELGLPQIHSKNLRGLTRTDGTKYDMTQRDEQVEAGVRWLAYAIQDCDSLVEGISAYKSGSCRPALEGAKLRVRRYRKARRTVGLDPSE